MILGVMSRTRHNILRYNKLIHKPTIINATPEKIFIFSITEEDEK